MLSVGITAVYVVRLKVLGSMAVIAVTPIKQARMLYFSLSFVLGLWVLLDFKHQDVPPCT
jgi:hypothetical protein